MTDLSRRTGCPRAIAGEARGIPEFLIEPGHDRHMPSESNQDVGDARPDTIEHDSGELFTCARMFVLDSLSLVEVTRSP